MKVLGINAIYHDPAAALVVDGRLVAAAEEERFSRRKHGKRPVPFSAWEMPAQSARWCLEEAGLRPEDVDVATYSFDPALHLPADDLGLFDPWDHLRATYAERAGSFLADVLPGFDPERLQYVPHHLAHAASAGLAAPFGESCAVLVLDGRGEAVNAPFTVPSASTRMLPRSVYLAALVRMLSMILLRRKASVSSSSGQ